MMFGTQLLTNPNRRFRARLNFGGAWGSHRHLLGVQVTNAQHALTYLWSLNFARYLFSSLFLEDADSLASGRSWVHFSDPTFGSKSELGVASWTFVIVSSTGIGNQGLQHRREKLCRAEIEIKSASMPATRRSVNRRQHRNNVPTAFVSD